LIYPRRAATGPDVARHYDELDVFYREVWGEHVHHGLWHTGDETPEVAVAHLVDHVASHARMQPGDAVCDVGAGYGATARHLAVRYQAHVTALTISPAQYAYALTAAPTAPNPTYLLQDWLANELPADAFDAVVSIECISHVPDKPRFFDEAVRVLRPGGRLVVCAWLAPEAPSRWQVHYVLEPICHEGRLPSLAGASEYRVMIAEAGLVLDAFEDLSRQVRRTWTVCVQRILHRLLTDRRYTRFLRDATHQNRRFLVTLFRLWLGYRIGAFGYGLFAARKP